MKKLLSILLALCMAAGSVAFASNSSNDTSTQQQADALNELGLFLGTDNGYELDAELNRAQALTLVVRLLGAEKEALSKNHTHPFTDVPDWASPYIGYAYTNGITNGMSADTFGSLNAVSQAQFLTFILRVLGYQDANDGTGDFVWSDPYVLTNDLGLTDGAASDSSFVRGNAVEIMWTALTCPMKGQDSTIADSLIEKGVFTEEAFEQAQNTAAGNDTEDKDNDKDPSFPSYPFYPDPTPDPDPDPTPDNGSGSGGDNEFGGIDGWD